MTDSLDIFFHILLVLLCLCLAITILSGIIVSSGCEKECERICDKEDAIDSRLKGGDSFFTCEGSVCTCFLEDGTITKRLK